MVLQIELNGSLVQILSQVFFIKDRSWLPFEVLYLFVIVWVLFEADVIKLLNHSSVERIFGLLFFADYICLGQNRANNLGFFVHLEESFNTLLVLSSGCGPRRKLLCDRICITPCLRLKKNWCNIERCGFRQIFPLQLFEIFIRLFLNDSFYFDSRSFKRFLFSLSIRFSF